MRVRLGRVQNPHAFFEMDGEGGGEVPTPQSKFQQFVKFEEVDQILRSPDVGLIQTLVSILTELNWIFGNHRHKTVLTIRSINAVPHDSSFYSHASEFKGALVCVQQLRAALPN